jgi:hypothetical protein
VKSVVLFSTAALVVLTPLAGVASTDYERVEAKYKGVLSFPRGVRAIGMGMTGTADHADPANVYYNPAVLAYGPGVALTGGTNNWQSGIDISDIGLSAAYRPTSRPRPNWRLGAGIRYARLDFEPSGTVMPAVIPGYASVDLSFSDWYLATTVAGGYGFGNLDIGLGFAVKYLEATAIGGSIINTWTYDAGVLAKYVIHRSEGTNIIPSVGVSGLNLGGTKDEGSEIIRPATQVRYGAGLRLEALGAQEAGEPLSRTSPVLAITIDGELLDFTDSDRGLGSGVGVELSMVNILNIRYGYADKQFAFDYGQTFGGGIGYGWRQAWFRLDFAMAFETDQSKNISAVGFLVDLDI